MCSTWSHSGPNALGRVTCWTVQLWIAANQRLCIRLMNKVAAKQTVNKTFKWCVCCFVMDFFFSQSTAHRIPETLLEAFKCSLLELCDHGDTFEICHCPVTKRDEASCDGEGCEMKAMLEAGLFQKWLFKLPALKDKILLIDWSPQSVVLGIMIMCTSPNNWKAFGGRNASISNLRLDFWGAVEEKQLPRCQLLVPSSPPSLTRHDQVTK